MTQSAPTISAAIRSGFCLVVALVTLAPHSTPFPGSNRPHHAPHSPTTQKTQGKELSTDRLLKALKPWSVRFLQDLGEADLAKNPELTELLGDLHLAWSAREDDRRRIVEALLDLQGELLGKIAGLPPELRPSRADRTGLKALDRALASKVDHETRRWLANETLLLEAQHPPQRRAAAARLIASDRKRSPGTRSDTLLSLLHAARSSSPLVRNTALEALVGTEDDTVHTFFLRALERALDPEETKGPGESSTERYERHFSSLELPQESRVAKKLQRFCRIRMASKNWRVALVALEVSKGLSRSWVMPPLIESLDIWNTRMETEGGGRRLAYALADELQRRTGRALGLHPDRWQKLWTAVQAGDLTLDDGVGAQGQAVSAAAFFGLRPATDRVTFVLDRSGSMETAFGNSTRSEGKKGASRPGWSRYREAVEQLLHFVESLGEKAKFNVVLFDNNSSIWRSKLQLATPQRLKAVRRWLLSRKPDGGTNLREGVMRALRVGRSGEPDLDELEADTIILLCDGGTNSGPAWVKPFLERTQEQTRVVFHSVQIGGGGDGTLQLLSEGTGGQLVRVEE